MKSAINQHRQSYPMASVGMPSIEGLHEMFIVSSDTLLALVTKSTPRPAAKSARPNQHGLLKRLRSGAEHPLKSGHGEGSPVASPPAPLRCRSTSARHSRGQAPSAPWPPSPLGGRTSWSVVSGGSGLTGSRTAPGGRRPWTPWSMHIWGSVSIEAGQLQTQPSHCADPSP